ncbi:MAG: DUF885 domain-containing protein [Candidatus Riflebacteria bacterium]|nr:DUF885 domain-containing protein [Candidatus Riflebacteria bacterium]
MRRQPVYRHPGFRKIAEHFSQEMLRRDPLTATYMGEHQYDGLLPEVGAEAVEKEIAFHRSMRDAFQALPERELSLDERLDRAVMVQLCQQALFFQEDLRRWRLGSDLATTIGDSLFLLFVRDFAPLAQRLEAIVSRLRSVPVFLMSGRTLFQDVPPRWGEIYLESADRLPDLFDALAKAIAGRVPATLQQEFAKAAAAARLALEQFRTWFTNAIMPNAHGDWALGAGPFQALLQLRRLGFVSGELHELGDVCLRQAHDRIDQMAHRLVGTGARPRAEIRKEAYSRVQGKGPATFEQALDTYRDAVARSRAFVEMTRFATLPDEERLEIVETPSYMAHLIPFAAYLSPERTARPQKGIYLVTRGPAADLARHNYADISNTSVHEGYPGHHLQLSAANLHPGQMRSFAGSIELCEGWALYCEEAMKHRGFEASEENLFIQAKDECWRAARVLIDVNIHQKTWTYDQGVQFLIEHTSMDEAAARAEMNRYTLTPGQPLSYLVGKHLLTRLKEDLQREFGGDFSDLAFHDLVLYEGSIPLSLAREYYPQMMRELLAAGPARLGA